MKRNYKNSNNTEAKDFFVGLEVELTPAHFLKTLFVVGIQDVHIIEKIYKEQRCEHIFFGANHSFDPGFGHESDNIWDSWKYMIDYFLKKDIVCSLDIPVKYAEEFLEGGLVEYDNFIPQLRVPIPYIKQWNYNTMVKIDDKGFKTSNPGVWCHSLHDLMDKQKFTSWSRYGLDDIIE